jgi:hypothetical protein
MAEQFVTVHLGSIFRNARRRFESLRDDIAVQGGKILRREEESSIRLRWFDSGRTLNSLQEEFVTEGTSRIYRLFPTAVSKRGAPYPLFGEYGFGRAGAASGRPAPKGYRYGDRAGMKARRFSRIAVQRAQPQIVAKAKEMIANFTVN